MSRKRDPKEVEIRYEMVPTGKKKPINITGWKRPFLIHTNQMEYQFTGYCSLPDILQLLLLVFFISYAWRISYSTKRGPKAYT